MAIDKSTWNKKIKVSQSTIDTIKKQGMSASLKSASSNKSGEYQEALRRMYGDKRVSAASGATPKKMTGQASGYRNPNQAAPMTGQPSGYRNPSQAGPKPAAKKASTSYSPMPMKAAPKKNNLKSNLLKGVGAAAAAGILIAGRGKGASVAAKLAPGLMKNKVAQALLTGEIKKVAPKVATKASSAVMKAKDTASVATGKAAAKAGKPVSQSQYDAMLAAAKSRSVTTAAKKAPVKKTAPKKTGLSAGRRFDANAPKAKTPKAK